MGLPRKATVGNLESVNNSIATSQTPAVAGNLTLTASPFTQTSAQRVVFFPAGAEGTNGTTWTITGTDWNGNSVTEVVAGVNSPATAPSVYDYLTVSNIAVNKGQAGAVTVGTNGTGSSRPIFLDTFAPAPTSLQIDVTGSVNATVQSTLDDPNAVGYASVTWVNHPDPNLNGITAPVQGNYAYIPFCTRIFMNSGTGTVTLTVIQADM
jgi:hypothetical protein